MSKNDRNKINIFQIIQDHHNTLIDYRTGRYKKADLFTFYFVPISSTAILVHYLGFRIGSEQTSILITALSIFAALLFNLLLLTHSIVIRNLNQEGNTSKISLLKEIYVNISYAILISILTIITLLIHVVFSNALLALIVTWLTSFAVLNFIFTLLLILKRIYSVLEDEFSED